jgi:hypothetical protein
MSWTTSQKVHLSRVSWDCASSLVISAYVKVRLIPRDSRALSRLGGRAFCCVVYFLTFCERLKFDDFANSPSIKGLA